MAFSFAPTPAAGGGFGSTLKGPAATPTFGGFGSTPAPTTGGSLFGQPAPAPSGGLFGAAPAPSTGFGGFGAAPAPSGGLFGASPAPQSGGLFGSSTTGTQGGLFGQPAPAPSGGSLFGSGFGSSLGGTGGFGAPATQGGGLFGTQQQQTQQQGFGVQAGTAAPVSELESSLVFLNESYSEKLNGQPNIKCRFKHLFYNIVDPATRHLYQRPNFVEPELWEQAERDNPDPDDCVPAPVIGFSELKDRLEHQQQHANLLRNAVEQLRKTVVSVQDAAGRTESVMDGSRRKQTELNNKFLKVLATIELQRCRNSALQNEEVILRQRLEQVKDEMAQPSAILKEIVSVQLQVERRMEGGRVEGITDLAAFHKALQMQKEGLQHVKDVLTKDNRDLEIIKKRCQR